MTVAELIAELEKIPREVEVSIMIEGDECEDATITFGNWSEGDEKVYISVWS
jgi:hypothetical protein